MLKRVKHNNQYWSNFRCIQILYRKNYSRVNRRPKMKMKIRIMASSLKMKMKMMTTMRTKMTLYLQTNFPSMTQKSFARQWMVGNFTKKRSSTISQYVAIFTYSIKTTQRTRSLSVLIYLIFSTPIRFSDFTKIVKGVLSITSTIFLIMTNGAAFMTLFRAENQISHCLLLK
jgi:hypothetical protein